MAEKPLPWWQRAIRFLRAVFQRPETAQPTQEAVRAAEPEPKPIATSAREQVTAAEPAPEAVMIAELEPRQPAESVLEQIAEAVPVQISVPASEIEATAGASHAPVVKLAATPDEEPVAGIQELAGAQNAPEPLAIYNEPSTAVLVQELEAPTSEAVEPSAREVEDAEPEPLTESPDDEPESAEEIVAVAEEDETRSEPESEIDAVLAGEMDSAALLEEEPAPEPELEPEAQSEPEPESINERDSKELEITTTGTDDALETTEEPQAITGGREATEATEPPIMRMESVVVEAVMQEEEVGEVETNEVSGVEPVKEPRAQIEQTPEVSAAADVTPEAVVQSNASNKTSPSTEPEPMQAAAPAPVGAPVNAPVKHTIKADDDSNSPFSIIVGEVYEGPMDLLLDLIRKQDIDIYDIPIAKITEQFLYYVERMRASEMDQAGEFIYTASLLIHIKSKMLLPRAPSGPDDQMEDPRRELVERLLEHERFKNAAQMLQQKQMLEEATWTNPGIREFKGDEGTEPELAADTVDLARVFNQILERFKNRPVINVEEDSVTVGQMIQFLARRLNMEDRPIALRKLLAHTHSRRALVTMFLALLELVRLQAILLRQDRLFSEIFIKKHEGFDALMDEGLLARDDWN